MLMDSGEILIDHRLPASGKVMQAFTGLRPLTGPYAEPEKWNSEGHSRCVIGKNALGRLLVLSTEGAYPNQGWTLAQCREFMLQHGAVVSADFGGGGDMTVFDRLKGLLLTPENPNGLQRYIPNFLTIKQQETNSMDGLAREKFGSQTRVRKTPSRYGEIVTTLNGYAEVAFTGIVPALISGTSDKAGEMWLKLTNGNYVNFKLYNSVGVLTEYFTITRQPTTEPVTTLPELKITVDAGAGYPVTVVNVKPL
jgi:hypothetical protein